MNMQFKSISFELNDSTMSLARKGAGTSRRIDESGAYVGEIEYARMIGGEPGKAKGIEVSFLSDDGQSAAFRIYIESKEGKPLQGLERFYALISCARIKKLTGMPGRLKLWNKDKNAMVDTDCIIFPEIARKKIGLFLQKVHDVYDGKPTYKMELYAPFTADTQQLADELEFGSKGNYEKVASKLKDKHVTSQKSSSTNEPVTGHLSAAYDGFDDDIAF